MVRSGARPYVEVVSTMTDPPAGPPADPDPQLPPPSDAPDPAAAQHADDSSDETADRTTAYPVDPSDDGGPAPVIGGVGYELGARLGIDPLWPRLALVGLALAGGLGLVLYAGLWLALVVGGWPGRRLLQLAGWALLGLAAVLVLDGSTQFWNSSWALVASLGGAALALWQPRGLVMESGDLEGSDEFDPTDVGGFHRADDTQQFDAGSPPGDATGVDPTAPMPTTWEMSQTWSMPRRRRSARRARRARRVRREPSILGRLTLGIAMLVAAGGALIDQADGGRIHPEQWLGAAAAVCGLGILVGAWRGRGWWLVIPAVAFAAAGFLGGHATRAGVDEWGWGDRYGWIGDDGQTSPVEVSTIAGNANLYLGRLTGDGAHTADMRVGVGSAVIDVEDGVSVKVIPVLHDGDVIVDGARRPTDEPFTFGPEGAADVTVRAEISLGDLNVRSVRRDTEVSLVPGAVPGSLSLPAETPPDTPPWLNNDTTTTVVDIGEGLMMASDGTVLLPDNVGAIGPDGQLWLLDPNAVDQQRDITTIYTPTGASYQLLPNQMIVSSTGTLIDVPALRRAQLAAATTLEATPSVSAGSPITAAPNAPTVTASPTGTAAPVVTTTPPTSIGG